MSLPDLTDLAVPGSAIEIRVTPKASRNRIERGSDGVRIYVTTVPENGKANAAVLKLLAKALGVPKSRLTITRGQQSRDKTIKVG